VSFNLKINYLITDNVYIINRTTQDYRRNKTFLSSMDNEANEKRTQEDGKLSKNMKKNIREAKNRD
jgi:hypothetical protein